MTGQHRRSGGARVLRVFVWLAAGTIGAGACTSGPPPPVTEGTYEERVQADRANKDDYFRISGESPIPDDEKASFTGLPYFPIDATYRVPATLEQERMNPPVIILMATSKDRPRRMQRVGTLHFTLHGQEQTLSAFVEEGYSLMRLFVPFADTSNGAETYHGGRNLELDRSMTGLYDLDFNRAYHPYCLYNAAYECPIPPAENRLAVAIRAGERLP
jgi:uncharacterized protein (DUF1684 family)